MFAEWKVLRNKNDVVVFFLHPAPHPPPRVPPALTPTIVPSVCGGRVLLCSIQYTNVLIIK